MNRATSIYLDLVRFSAAMIVLIGHLSGTRFTGGLFWRVGAFMDDAVMVFFVLSGFVIAYVVHHKEGGLEQYAVARAARIYSVALPALVITFALDAMGRQIAPDLYSPSWGYHADHLAGQFLAGVLFVNQLWYASIDTGSMLPYWSLGFEVWYYLFFAIFFFSRSRWKVLIFLAACTLAGPRIVAFFPVWILGYLTYMGAARYQPGRVTGLVVMAASLAGYAVYYFILKGWLIAHAVVFDDAGLSNFVPRYVVGVLFALHLTGFVWTEDTFAAPLTRWKAPIRWLAGGTFTIYLFHLPVAQFLTTIVPWPPADWRTRVIILGVTICSMFVIAQFTERKKETWSRWISGAARGIRQRLRPAAS